MKRGTLQFTSAPELVLRSSQSVGEINAPDAIAPHWICLAPFGEHRTRDGKRVQVLDAASAKELVETFNFWPRRVARLFEINAVPVWLGHPDFAPEEWPDKTQLGHVAEIAARDEALWGRVEWNAQGLRTLGEGEHRFPSVAWEVVYGGSTRGTPINLWSVGIWRTPNIRDTPPIVRAEINSEQETAEQTNDNEPPDTMKDKLLALLIKLGLLKEAPADEAAETAALTELETALGTLTSASEASAQMLAISEALKGLSAALKLDGEKTPLEIITAAIAALEGKDTEAEAMKTEVNALKTSRVELALQNALASGAVTKAQLPATRAKLAAAADFDAVLTEINSAAPKLNMHGLKLPRLARAAASDAQTQRAEINAWIEEKMGTANLTYNAAYKLAKDEFPEHFKPGK